MKTRPQTDKVIEHILAYGSITAAEAYSEFGCMRLASRICDLKAAGYNIGKVMEEGYIKRVDYDPEHIRLISLNPYYPPLVFTGPDVLRVYVVGRVVRSITRW